MVYWCYDATPLIAYLFANSTVCSFHTNQCLERRLSSLSSETHVYSAYLKPARRVSISIRGKKIKHMLKYPSVAPTLQLQQPRSEGFNIKWSTRWLNLQCVLKFHRILLVWISKYSHEAAACFANHHSGQHHHYHPSISWVLHYLLFSDC